MKELAQLVALMLIALGALAWINDWPKDDDRMPLYMGRCSHAAASHELCKAWALVGLPGNILVNRELGVVVFELMSLQIPQESCTIQNAHNWRCRDGSQTIAGRFQYPRTSPDDMIQVPKWKWLKLKYWDKVPAAVAR